MIDTPDLIMPSNLSRLFRRLAVSLTNILNFGTSDKPYTSIFAPQKGTDHTFVTNELGFITYFIELGASHAPTPYLRDSYNSFFTGTVNAFLKDGHMIVDCFTSHSDNIDTFLNSSLNHRDKVADKLGLDNSIKNQALYQMLRDCNFEFRIIGLYTPNDLPNVESLSDFRNVSNIYINSAYNPNVDNSRTEPLLDKHREFVDSYKSCNERGKIDSRILKHSEALQALYEYTHPQTSNLSSGIGSSGHEALLPKYPSQSKEVEGFSNIAGVDLASFLFPNPPKQEDDSVVLEDMRYRSITVDLLMRDIKSFTELHREIKRKGLPYRYKLVIGGDPITKLKSQYDASKFQFGGKKNTSESDLVKLDDNSSDRARYADAYQLLSKYKEYSGVIFVQIVFTTWVEDKDDKRKLKSRITSLENILRQWAKSGVNLVSTVRGSALLGFYSTLPGYHGSIGKKLVQTTESILDLLPSFRPTFPFQSSGELIVRSYDGNLINFNPTKGRNFCINYVVGSPGTGKSVVGNKFLDAAIFGRGNDHLPLHYRIDKGASSKEANNSYVRMNPKLKRYFKFIPIQNTKPTSSGISEHINIFDSPLGLREPLPHIIPSIISLLTQNLIGIKGDNLPDAKNMLTTCLETTLDKFKNRSYQKRIDVTTIPSLSSTLRQHKYILNTNDSFDDFMPIGYDLVEFLMFKGEFYLATLVQAQCSITIEDLIATASSAEFMDKFNLTKGGMNIGIAFKSGLESIKSNYPFISYPSTIHLSLLRIVTFELGDILLNGQDLSTIETNMFWFGLCTLYTRANAFVHEDLKIPAEAQFYAYGDTRSESIPCEGISADEVEQASLKYILKNIQTLNDITKYVDIDELQAYLPVGEDSSTANYATAILEPLNNEARKWSIAITYFSQYPYHGRFMGEMSGIYILGFNNPKTADSCLKYFHLSQDEIDIYIKSLRLDPKKGVHMFVVLRGIKIHGAQQEYHHQMYLPIPGYDIWDYASAKTESAIRTAIFNNHTPQEAKYILVGALPNAGASQEFHDANDQLVNSGEFDSATDDSDRDTIKTNYIVKKMLNNAAYYAEIGRKSIHN